MALLTTTDMAKPRLERARQNRETYKLILARCYQAMEGANERRLFFVRFMVPGHVMGRPAFDPSHAVFYVCGKLHKGGFLVRHVPPTGQLLHVEWAHARPSAQDLPAPKPEPRKKPSLLELLGKA